MLKASPPCPNRQKMFKQFKPVTNALIFQTLASSAPERLWLQKSICITDGWSFGSCILASARVLRDQLLVGRKRKARPDQSDLNESKVAMPMHVLKLLQTQFLLKALYYQWQTGGLRWAANTSKTKKSGKRNVHKEARAFVRISPPSLFALYFSFKPSRQVSKVCSKQTDCLHEVVWFSKYFRDLLSLRYDMAYARLRNLVQNLPRPEKLHRP